MAKVSVCIAFSMAATLFAAEPQQELHPLPSSLTQREILEQACMLVVPFGCEKVLSLDGGGSSVMAIRKGAGNPSGEARPTPPTPLEIVSNPCDNGKFDAGGERRVCDGIMLIDRR
jgi:hypothetical protein